ncbi:MAG: ABC transporter permease subunit [Prolixibacteraceae bacterium]|nr:ABC transporter permease subunit [Prolixibacteraceae bacterium]
MLRFSNIYLLIIAILFLNSCKTNNSSISKLSMLEGGKTIAVPTGTVADQFVLARFPKAKIVYYNTVLDCALAVKDGKAHAAAYDKPILKNIAAKNNGLRVLDELLVDDNYGFAVDPTNHTLKQAMDKTLAQLQGNGTYQQMLKRWFPNTGPPQNMPEIELSGQNGTLRFGTAAVTEPMSFFDARQKISGFDIEYATYIAQHLDLKLEIIDMEFGALLPALISGKVDMIGAGMSITEERAKKVLFSEPYYKSGIAAIVALPKKEKNKSKKIDINNIGDKKLGVLMGSIHDKYANKTYPNATISQFQSISDMLTALQSSKVDVVFYEDACLSEILTDNSKIGIVQRNIFSAPIGAAFNKNNTTLLNSYNTFLAKIKTDGTYNDIVKRWIETGNKTMPEFNNNTGKQKINIGISSDLGFPYVAMQNGMLVGFDVELATRFANDLNMEVNLVDMPFGSLIAAISTGKIDLIHSSMMITEERSKQVNFSDVYFESGATLIALSENIENASQTIFQKLDDIANKRIGIYTGTVHDAFLAQNYPNAKRFLFDFPADMILALKTDKVDAIMLDNISAQVIVRQNPDLSIFHNDFFYTPLGIGFNKNNPQLRLEFNEFLQKIKNDGTYNAMRERWFTNDAEKALMPQIAPSNSQKQITAGVAIGDLPYVSYVNGQYVGFDIEMLQRFALNNNYQLKIITLEFASLIAALHSGKVDLIADGISISEERAKKIDFSEPYADFRSALVVAKKNTSTNSATPTKIKTSFFESISNSIHSNIITEKRYLLIINGLKTTFIISILAALLGTLIGALLCFLRMSKNKTTNKISALFIDLIRGTPVLVLLMIIFYVVFASVNISPVLVAIIAFGINFGAYVSEMFRSSIISIDKGQREAGIASGFTQTQTFIHIIMPQALQRVIPVYKGEFISLIKMTSIVGYIAVQDLTKASDIIRSRTFDAFFPLLMAAVLYILIAGIFTWLLSRVEISVDPKRRKIKKIQEGKA